MEGPTRPEDTYTAAATEIAARYAKSLPKHVHRFTTGAAHFVFEASFRDRAAIVVRISRPSDRTIAKDSAQLSNRLRPLGIPLPEILEDGTDATHPYLVLERLPGTDLGDVISSLRMEQLDSIANKIAEAQSVVAGTPSGGRYGFAANPENAPYATWGEVLEEHRARSRSRIITAGLFNVSYVDRIEILARSMRSDLNAVPATPYLHDTTTKNVIITPEGELSGIVDVDDLCYGIHVT